MVKFLIGAVVAAVAFTVYAVIDCAWSPRSRIRALSKPVWVIVVIVLPVIGGVLWFLLGRAPERRGASRQGRPRVIGPDDDPDFLGTFRRPGPSQREKDQTDATLRNLEAQLGEPDRTVDPNDPDARGRRGRRGRDDGIV